MTPSPARDGWDERKNFDYETSPNERAVIRALAWRAGENWTVVILDGKEPTFEKRGSQFGLIVQSLRPKGYNKETFAGRKALPLTPERIAELKSLVEGSMKKLDIPGASLALVDGGRVVYEGGLGVRELGKPEPIDADTLFMAAGLDTETDRGPHGECRSAAGKSPVSPGSLRGVRLPDFQSLPGQLDAARRAGAGKWTHPRGIRSRRGVHPGLDCINHQPFRMARIFLPFGTADGGRHRRLALRVRSE